MVKWITQGTKVMCESAVMNERTSFYPICNLFLNTVIIQIER